MCFGACAAVQMGPTHLTYTSSHLSEAKTSLSNRFLLLLFDSSSSSSRLYAAPYPHTHPQPTTNDFSFFSIRNTTDPPFYDRHHAMNNTLHRKRVHIHRKKGSLRVLCVSLMQFASLCLQVPGFWLRCVQLVVLALVTPYHPARACKKRND